MICFVDIYFPQVALSLSYIKSCGLGCQRVRSACFGVGGVKIFSRQLFRTTFMKYIISVPEIHIKPSTVRVRASIRRLHRQNNQSDIRSTHNKRRVGELQSEASTDSFWPLTWSCRHIEITFLIQPACFSVHTDKASTQPACVVSINHQETHISASEFLHPP